MPVEKREKHRKYRLIEKEYAKRKQKYEDSRLKATKARNEYLLCMDAANSSIQKYFVDDLSDLIDVSISTFFMHFVIFEVAFVRIVIIAEKYLKVLSLLEKNLIMLYFFKILDTDKVISKISFEVLPQLFSLHFQCMDFGFHQSLSRAVMMHVSGMDQRRRSLQHDIDHLNKGLSALDSRLDKQRFIEFNNNTFMIPKKFEYTPVRRDEVGKKTGVKDPAVEI